MDQDAPSSAQYNSAYDSNISQQTWLLTSESTNPQSFDRARRVTWAPLPSDSAAHHQSGRAEPSTSQLHDFSSGDYYDAVDDGSHRHQYDDHHHVTRPSQPYGQQEIQEFVSSALYGQPQVMVEQCEVHRPIYGQSQHYRPSNLKYETLPEPDSDPHATRYYTGVQPDPSAVMGAAIASPSQMASHFQPATYAHDQPVRSLSTHDAMLDTMQQDLYHGYGQQYTTFVAAPPPQPLPALPPTSRPLLPLQPRISHFQQACSTEEHNLYQNKVRSVFEFVRSRNLVHTPELLLEAAQYIKQSVEKLGLNRDEEGQHQAKIALFDEFNRAWLTTMQCQFDMVQALRAGIPFLPTQSILNREILEEVSKELVKMCDRMQTYALVDYAVGVAESEIIDIILRCLTQLDEIHAETTIAGAEDLEHFDD